MTEREETPTPWPDRTPRRAILIGIIALLATAAGYVFLSSRGSRDKSPKEVRPALTVTVVSPSRSTWPETIAASGAISPYEEASIGTQIGSYQLVDVRVNVGDQVRRGQVLARLNPALLHAEETQLVARDEQARANDQRAKGLQADGGISEQDALQAATEAKTAAALLAAKRLELRYTEILAPDDGVITARPATVGAVVPAGQELFRMIRRNRLEWRGELTASQLMKVRKGQQVDLMLPDGSAASASIRETAPSLDAQSRIAIVYGDLTAGSHARAGMYVNGKIAVGETLVWSIPAECVIIRDGRSYVVELANSGATSKVALHLVTTGQRIGDAVEIAQGLRGGERIVRRGGAFLDDGEIVRISSAGKGGR